MAKDIVCGMGLEEKNATHKSQYKGRAYYFCGGHCKTNFDTNPAKYVKE